MVFLGFLVQLSSTASRALPLNAMVTRILGKLWLLINVDSYSCTVLHLLRVLLVVLNSVLQNLVIRVVLVSYRSFSLLTLALYVLKRPGESLIV